MNALEAVSGLDRTSLPAPVAATSGGVAVGADAAAAGEDSLALGRGASATGARGIAIGAGAAAGANEVVIGSAGHTTYRMPGLAATPTVTDVQEVLIVDGDGDLSADGGTLDRRLGRPDDSANSGDFRQAHLSLRTTHGPPGGAEADRRPPHTGAVSGRAVADPPRRPGSPRGPGHAAPASSAGSTTRTSPAALSVMQNTVKYSISGSTP